jgi:hypothetical protein
LTARLERGILAAVSAQEIIEQIKALPAKERAQVAKFVVENDDSWIPESFQQGMADAEAGRLVDLDTALNEPYLESDQGRVWRRTKRSLVIRAPALTPASLTALPPTRRIPIRRVRRQLHSQVQLGNEGTHKIHKLSARYGRTIYSAEIEADLRAVFYVEGDMIVTVDIGSHSIYR